MIVVDKACCNKSGYLAIDSYFCVQFDVFFFYFRKTNKHYYVFNTLSNPKCFLCPDTMSCHVAIRHVNKTMNTIMYHIVQYTVHENTSTVFNCFPFVIIVSNLFVHIDVG